MSSSEKQFSSLSSSSSSSSLSSLSLHEIDPLLKDLNEKKQSFRRNVVSLATELKEVRSRLASLEQSFVKETLTRQVAETKAETMEEEIGRMQKRLEERNEQLQASAANAEKMGGLRDKAIKELKDQIAAKQREVGKAEKKKLLGNFRFQSCVYVHVNTGCLL